jgi:hypothetical protein
MKSFTKSTRISSLRQERPSIPEMNLRGEYLLRVKSCIGTIIDVHKSISGRLGDEALLPRFSQLETALDEMDMSRVSELDVRMVEQATNALLVEFQPAFDTEEYGPVYEGIAH